MDSQEALNLLLASPEFAALEEQGSTSAILELAGMSRKETAHTRLLAWLLDPSQPHGLGASPLKSFLHMAWRCCRENAKGQALSPMDIDKGPDLDNAIVAAEFVLRNDPQSRPKGRSDVFAYFGDAARPKPLLFVEYKVYAPENDGQTIMYADWVGRLSGELKPTLVFLTRDGEVPQHDGFVPVSYMEFGQWLAALSSARSSRAGMRVIEELRRLTELFTDRTESINGLDEAIEVLRTHAASDMVKAAEAKHSVAFRLLGIISGDVYDSPVLNAVSKVVASVDSGKDRHWGEANRSTLTFWSRDIFGARRKVFEGQPDREELWGYLEMADPQDGSKAAILELGIGTSVPELKDEKRALVGVLRSQFSLTDSKKLAKLNANNSQAIARLMIPAKGEVVKVDDVKASESAIREFVTNATKLLQAPVIKEKLLGWKKQREERAALSGV